MRNYFLLVLVLFFSSTSLRAQTAYSVKGSVIDLSINEKLVNTSISVLNAKDSTLVKFTRAAAGGDFTISNLKAGKFILLVTYPDYADYVEHFSLDSANRQRDFGTLSMLLKKNLLSDVIIKGEAIAIKIKGDTTEFNAAAYKIEPNSKVEDLLKQLPGIQVDKDGKITAQGQTVAKVLVDGEEFFGDDPTLVTKNLRGDMVDKVQLFDKKSDQATFTGIDDGEKTKTLNIQLKEDKKKGYFGKADAGLATSEFFQGQAMANFFKAKKKFSAYATVGNTGRTGLQFEDAGKYGTSGVQFTDGGGIMIMSSNDNFESFDGRYNNQGIPDAQTGGLHFDNKWNKDKQSINGNFRIGSIGVEGLRSGLNQNNLPGGTLNSLSGQHFDNTAFRQKLDLTYELKLDSTSNLKISADGTLKNSQTDNEYASTSLRDNRLLNNSTRTLNNDEKEQLLNFTAFWNKKLKKTGRTVSLTLGNSLRNNETKGFLNSVNNFYDSAEQLDSVQLIDQYKTNTTVSSVFNSNLTYTEPISKYFSAVMNYGFSMNNSSADRRSFNKSAQGEYDSPDAAFSNDFSLNQTANQLGAIFNFKKDNTNLNFGSKASAVNFQQVDQFTGREYKRDFLNLTPQASLGYKLGKQKTVRFNYFGSTTQPTLNQVQPVRINDDPLNITIGNPDLKTSFRNSFNLGYNSYKLLTEQYIYMNASYGFTSRAIVNSLFTDSAGKNTYQSVNSTGKAPSFFYLSANLSRKVTKSGLSVGVDMSANGNTYYNLINNALNRTESYNFSGGLVMRQSVPKKYNFYVYATPIYTREQSSLQKQINNNGWNFNSRASLSVNLPGKVEIATDGSYEHRGKTESFTEDFDRLIWNTTLSKKFMKTDNLNLSLTGKDLLNQNIGFSRSAISNMITQSSYSTIGRYFMLSLVYDFNKMGAGAPAK